MFVEDPLTDPRKPDLNEVPTLKTFEDIVKHFAPITVDRSRGWDVTPVGEACWKLVGFHVTVGITVITPIVRKEDGSYLPDKEVNLHFPHIPGHEVRPDYFPRGLSARTKGPPDNNGAHFTVSGDHNVAPDAAGPDSIWVAAEPGGPQFSDAVHGLGMRVNTNHLIVSPVFQFVIKGEDEPGGGDPPPVTTDAFLEVVVNDQALGRVPLSPVGADVDPEAGEHTLSIVVGGQEVGRVSFGPAATGGDALVLRDGPTEIGRIPWQPNE